MDRKKSSSELRKKPTRRRTTNSSSRSRRDVDARRRAESNNELYSHSKDKSFNLSTMGKRAKNKKSKTTLIVTNVLLSILLVFSSITFTATAMLESRLFKNKTIDVEETGDFEDIKVSPNANVAYFLVCGVDLSENLTDIIMVVCYDLANNEANILQIPRDTYVGDVPSGKINAVYGNPREGESKIKALIRCINSKFGIPIDNYVTITVHGTEKVIDAMGGLDINLTKDFSLIDDSRKPQQHKTFYKGKNHLDGQWATALIRNRAGTEGGSDMGRLKNQRSIYSALLKQLTTVSFSEIYNIVTNCMKEVSTDLPVGLALGYAEKVNQLNLDSVNIMTLPGQTGTINGLSCWICHKQDTVNMLNEYFRPYDTIALTTNDLSIVDYSEIGAYYDTSYDSMLQQGSLNDFDNEATTAPATVAQ